MAAKYKRVLAVLILLLLVAQMLYIGQKKPARGGRRNCYRASTSYLVYRP